MVKALVVMDMSKGEMKNVDNPKKIIKNQVKLVTEFKKHNLPVILVGGSSPKKYKKNPVMIRLWGEEFKDDPEGINIVPELLKFKYDLALSKPEYDVFYNTDFEKYCKKKKIDEIYFTGIYSGCCVYFSSAGAAIRAIQPYLVEDATGSPRKNMVNKGWHKDTLERYKLMIGPVISTKQVIKELVKK